ncbi:hypothetical protein [Nocardiopsis alborubida]|uniref:Uncharacterized protein n=1 Tax=Nocardiopsis alborubida TaxID=146802 RepID=A0A7X6MGI0_9ACTN|nr:hypothetical protein [Nocardiopsis alborubida]NKZ00085.1 hypothetical protein [Nocardiopsis alborubida]
MARSEFIMTSEGVDEVVAKIRSMPDYEHEKAIVDTVEVHLGGMILDIEELDIYDGFSTSIEVYGSDWNEVSRNAEYIFHLLENETGWRLGMRFDGDDNPTWERPGLP